MPYTFFLSYARCDADRYFERFKKDLIEAVRVRVGGDARDVAFVDREDIATGQTWPEALLEGLETSAVLVPVYSRSYFASDYCGREWEVFRMRRALAAAQGKAHPPVIQPLLWVGKEDLPDPLPDAASELQFAHADFGDLYADKGMRLLVFQARYREEGRRVIEALSQRIVEVSREHPLPSLAERPDLRNVRSAFLAAPAQPLEGPARDPGDAPPAPARPAALPGGAGPRYVQFVFVAGTRAQLAGLRREVDGYGEVGGEEWRPFYPDVASQVADVATEVAGSERLFAQPLALSDDLMDQLDEAARQDRLVACIVDTWSLRLAEYHAFMRQYDGRSFLNCFVLVPWNGGDAETAQNRQLLEDAVRLTFPTRAVKDPTTFMDGIASLDDLRTSLATGLAHARARIIQAAEVRRRAESGSVIVKPVINAVPEGGP